MPKYMLYNYAVLLILAIISNPCLCFLLFDNVAIFLHIDSFSKNHHGSTHLKYDIKKHLPFATSLPERGRNLTEAPSIEPPLPVGSLKFTLCTHA